MRTSLQFQRMAADVDGSLMTEINPTEMATVIQNTSLPSQNPQIP